MWTLTILSWQWVNYEKDSSNNLGTDDYVDYIGLNELKRSFKHFHPDVDFFVFDTKMTNEAKEKDPG